MPAGKLDTDMLARPEKVLDRPILGPRPLPAPVCSDIAPLATTCEQGSAIREPVVRPGSNAPGPIDISPTAHTQAGSGARAGAVDRFRRISEGDTGDTDLAKDKRELLLLFASGRDTGFILAVTEGDIASPTGASRTRFRWPVPRAETTQGHPAAPVQVSAHGRFTIDGGSLKYLKKVEVAERAKRDEERLVEALSEQALVKAARLEEDKRDLLLLFASGRDTGFILDVTESDIASPTRVAPAPFRWPVLRAETPQGRPAAPVPVSASRGSSKHLKKLEAAERVERDEERSLEALSEKARAKAARLEEDLEKDKRDLLSLFVSRRDAGLIMDVTGSSPPPRSV